MEPPPCRWITPALCPTSSGRESLSWRRAGWARTAFSTRARCSRNVRPASPRLHIPSDTRLRRRRRSAVGPRHGRLLRGALLLGGQPGERRDGPGGRRAFYAAAAMIVIAGGVL